MKTFIAGTNNAQVTVSVAHIFGEAQNIANAMQAPWEVVAEFMTESGWLAATEAAAGVVYGITARKPANKKEHVAEVAWAVDAMNMVVEQLLSNKQGDVMSMVVIGKGVSVTKEQIVDAMVEKGLVIGGQAETKLGIGRVHGFEANTTGLLVLVDYSGDVKKFMSNAVSPVLTNEQIIQQELIALAPAAVGMSTDINQLIADVQYSIEGFVDAANPESAPVAEPTFDEAQDARDLQKQAWIAEQNAKASVVAGSAAADKILAMAAALVPAAPAAAPAVNATPVTPKQTNGGNVQMQNVQTRGTQVQVKDAPAQSVAAGTPARQQQAAPSRTTGQPSRGAASTATPAAKPGRTTGTMRANVGSAPTAAQGRKRLALKTDAVASFRREGQWYMDAKYTRVLSPEVFEDTRANADLGITDAKMYDAQDYAQRFNKDARDNEVAVMEIFFGAISFEFKINASISDDARTPWYCGNVSFVENKRGGEWKYTVARRSDAVNVVVLTDGSVREATAKEVEAKQSVVLGGTAWKNKEAIYGIKMHEEVMAQVMRWAHYGWEMMYPTEVAAK